eukprot:g8772.t1
MATNHKRAKAIQRKRKPSKKATLHWESEDDKHHDPHDDYDSSCHPSASFPQRISHHSYATAAGARSAIGTSSSSYHDLEEMFPNMDPGTIGHLMNELQNKSQVLDLLLQMSQDQARALPAAPATPTPAAPAAPQQPQNGSGLHQPAAGRAGEGRSDVHFPFTSGHHDMLAALPEDALRHVLAVLDVYSLCRLSRASKALDAATRACFEAMHSLSAAKHLLRLSDDQLCAMITRLPNLDSLSFSKCAAFSRMQALPRACFPSAGTLLRLNFAKCSQLRDRHLETLLEVTDGLTHLDLSDTEVSDLSLEYVLRLKRLAQLNLHGCRQVTSAGVDRLLGLAPELRELNLKSTLVTVELFAPGGWAGKTLQLRKLDLARCKRLAPRLELGTAFKRLTELNLSSNLGLERLELSTPLLEKLNLSQCKYLRALSLRHGVPNLHTVNFSGASNLTELTTPAPFRTQLQTANLCQCRSLSHQSFLKLALSSPTSLNSLNLSGMIQLSDQLVLEFLPKVASLSELRLEGCRQLSAQVQNTAEAIMLRRHRQREEDKLTKMFINV